MRILLFSLLTVLSGHLSIACTGGAFNQGTLTPTAAYQTTPVVNGNYYSINVSCGNQYNFDFCANGGSAGSLWAEITILNNAGTVEYAFAPYAGGCTTLSWTATFTGTIRVYITDSGCSASGSWSGTMAYNVSSGGPLSANFTLAATGCDAASATVTGSPGGTFSLLPPTGGASVDPSTGALTGGSTGSTYTIEYDVCGSSQQNSITLPPGDPTFSLSVECGGGTSTITGHTGGTFAFNPAPGDGAQVDATTGTVTNGTVGTTYYVEYTVCGVSSTQSVTVLSDDCWTLNGNAQYINVAGEDCIQLTAAVNNQTGCAWSGSQIDFATDFSLTLDYYFGNNINGADGNTFTFQPSSSTACGQNGGQLGAGGLSNALSIEFDTYDNDNPTHLYDMSCDHIAVEIDGNMQGPGAPYCGPTCAKPGGGNIDDGGTYQVDIVWNSATQNLEIWFNGSLRLTCNGDFVNTVFGGQSQVYWGATSATGGLNNQQYFCPSTIVILPSEMGAFENTCYGETEEFSWTTITESRVDYFQLEYTYDGLVFYPVGKVDATGTSQTEQHYAYEVKTDDTQQRYYRLKVVDDNGEYEYTDIIQGKRCGISELIQQAYIANNMMEVRYSDDVEMQLIDQMGKVLYHGNSVHHAHTLSTASIQNGVYFILARTSNGTQESRRIIIAD